MISVVMANYNGEEFIGETITSVINQDYDDYEFIIVDDGSVDRSREIIADFHKQYPDKIKPIYQSKNCGQGIAFNAGITASEGNIICFLDSDDLWLPNKLRNVNKYLSESEDVALFQHNLFFIRNGKITNKKFRDILISGDYYNYTKKSNTLPFFVATTGLSFPRHILEKVLPIPEEFRTCADGYLTRTSFCYGRVLSIDECWGAYRVHPSNRTFENPEFDSSSYTYTLLIPFLNRYYKENNIELKFPIQEYGLIQKIVKWLPPIIPMFIKLLIPPILVRKLINTK